MPPAKQNTGFSRLRMLVGGSGLEKLASAHVGIFGLGAVGSFAAEALARSGIEHFRLVDFDSVRPSNINRQLLALHSTIGKDKIELASARIKDINPLATVDARKAFFHIEEAETLLEGLDFVVDAIDSLNPKVTLIAESVKSKIKVVSAMGAAGRLNPALIRVTDISKVRGCPLSFLVRKRLHRLGVREGVTAVWSEEPPSIPSLSEAEMSDEKESESYERGRKRHPLPSSIFGPASFGLAAAHWVVSNVLA